MKHNQPVSDPSPHAPSVAAARPGWRGTTPAALGRRRFLGGAGLLAAVGIATACGTNTGREDPLEEPQISTDAAPTAAAAAPTIAGMPELPKTSTSLLVRTDFRDDAAWQALQTECTATYEDDFRAELRPVSDPAFDGADWETLWKAVPANPDDGAAVLFIADTTAFDTPDHPIQVINLIEVDAPIRCIPAELWGVENNLNVGNMDWSDFAGSVGPDGVFRGF